ncbi:glycerophosphodiester phosphodiesterase [Lewinellaceae bacterium SD302]|nr:glycerophosphodiester phosphodiesterase [Lewinellaceae bacterium SD302]
MRYTPIFLLLLSCTNMSTSIDYQGHRGARGLYPENTIPAFLHALEYPAISTLEMDVVLTKDGTVLVSHDPWLVAELCTTAGGNRLDPADSARISILSLRIDEAQSYDCGNLPHPRFPEQRKMFGKKPRLAQVFEAVESYCRENDRELPRYNIEIKYLPEWEAQGFVASMRTNIEAVLAVVNKAELADRTTIQCFHPPVLQLIHEQQPDLHLAYLDEFPEKGELAAKMDALGFIPPAYSPWHEPLSQSVIDQAHELGMTVVPWTVNETARMEELVEMGVDGVITDYPNRVPE